MIAKHLQKSLYWDSVVAATENQLRLMEELQEVKDSLLAVMNREVENQQRIKNQSTNGDYSVNRKVEQR